MKLALLASLIASAAAFAPSKVAQTSTTSTTLKAFENELGVQPPLGFWDPLGLLDNADQERFDRLRYVEIKHGRIAMLAVLGHITTSSGRTLGGNIDFSGTAFSSIKTGLAGLSDIPQAGLLQIVAFIGFLELFVMKDAKGTGEFPGDFRNGIDFGWNNFSDEEKMQKRAIELNNGRAAQMGILGLMVHEKIGGDPYIINELLGYHTV
uniref:FCPI-12 n=1 Tax=Chaetoceros neogracilis TaxID=240364 RepID=UPI00186589AB|nr:Chain T, FCPI-12 [Chaetoceros gracilis]